MTLTGNEPQILKELAYTRDNISVKNFAEMYHDAITQKDELLTLFNLGYLGLEDRSKGETLFWEVCRKLSRILSNKSLKYIPEEFQDLNKSLADKLIANFSIFQSMPDHWAIEQLFPVMPIHRLKEKPALSATLCDITCDSDGKMEKFIDLKDVRDETPLPRAPRRRVLLRGLLPHRRLPGHPGHAAQPLRRAQRGPHRGPRRRHLQGAAPRQGRHRGPRAPQRPLRSRRADPGPPDQAEDQRPRATPPKPCGPCSQKSGSSTPIWKSSYQLSAVGYQ